MNCNKPLPLTLHLPTFLSVWPVLRRDSHRLHAAWKTSHPFLFPPIYLVDFHPLSFIELWITILKVLVSRKNVIGFSFSFRGFDRSTPREQMRPPRGPDRHGHGMARSPASPGQPQTPSSTRPPNGSCQPTDVPWQEHTSPFPTLPGDTGGSRALRSAAARHGPQLRQACESP